MNDKKRRYYLKHKADVLSRNKQWALNNPEKMREYKRKWQAAHPENSRARAKRHYLKNRIAILHRERIWRAANPDKERDKKKRWRDKHPKAVREEKRRWYQRHKRERQQKAKVYYQSIKDKAVEKEKRRESLLRWRRGNPEASREQFNRRRALKLGAHGSHTTAQWLARVEFYGWRCVYCSTRLTRKTLTQDHRIPLAKGGTNFASNLVPACAHCNSKKGVTRTSGKRR